ncbi:MAG: hypothetical protein ABEL51_01025 [Salinibacter sp.]
MRVYSSSIGSRLLGALVLGGALMLWCGCDTVPAPETRRQPSVSGLQIVPDSVHESDLPPDQVKDSTVVVPLIIDSVRATDPDGSVARVVFVLEPSSNPRGTVSGELPAQTRPIYGARVPLSLPREDEIYTVRVFAVDNDSLASNQVTGQFRFVPADSANGQSRGFSALTPAAVDPQGHD